MCDLGWTLRYAYLTDPSPEARVLYESHVRHCPECKADLERINRMSKVVEHKKVSEE